MSPADGAATPSADDLLAWRRGVTFAVYLLRGARGQSDEACLDPRVRNQRPQLNLVRDTLDQLRAINDPRVEEAFGAVMSDFITSCIDGGIPDVALLQRLARNPIDQQPRVNLSAVQS